MLPSSAPSIPIAPALDALKACQRDAICAAVPGAGSASDERLAAAAEDVLRLLRELFRDDPELETLGWQLVTLTAGDPRLAFLEAVPAAAALPLVRTRAIEAALFGTQTQAVAEIGLLMALFTLTLDGLRATAVRELADARPWLTEVMRGQAWVAAGPGAVPAVPSDDLHPLAQLLLRIATGLITRITAQPGWRDDAVRAELRIALADAYDAELTGPDTPIVGGDRSPGDLRVLVAAKPSARAWREALIPLCVHGWPPALDACAFARFAAAVGAYSGWVDGAAGVARDVEANRWNPVLLELERLDHGLAQGPRSTAPVRLVRRLQTPGVVEALADDGVERLEAVRDVARGLGRGGAALETALVDVARASLVEVGDAAA